MESVFISGRFINKETGEPIDGAVELIPSRLWVDELGVSYATLAPATVTVGGKFVVEVTSCHQREGDHGWFYQIKCPMGTWSIRPQGKDGEVLTLRSMLPSRFQ